MRKNQKIATQSIWTNPIHFVACGFGSGLLPIAPGTWGTMVGVVLYLILSHFPLWFYILSIIICILLGVWLCGTTNRDFGTEDHPAAVWDEIAAFPIVMLGIPFYWPYIIGGFILFRLFDILKPWPIRWLDQNLHGGWGVMLDDIAAAIFALLIMHLIKVFT